MKWNILYNAEKQYAEIITTGIADTESSGNMAKAIASELGPKKISKILIDHSNLEGVSGEVKELYSREKEFENIGIPVHVKIAEVIKPEYQEHFKLLEIILSNRGFNVAIFYDRATALEWLLRK